jgi:hypothetical protein
MQGRLGSLVLTQNRSRILSAKALPDGRLAVRIHRCFETAPVATLNLAADFLSGHLQGQARSKALGAIRHHFDLHAAKDAVQRAPKPPTLAPLGCRFNLQDVLEGLNRQYFSDKLEVEITWGRAGQQRRRQSIRLGSYQASNGLIRLHRALDQPWVPTYVIEAIVFHEMLHADIAVECHGSRRRIHSPEFRRREALFPAHQRSEAWLRKNLDRLLGKRGGSFRPKL